MSWQRWVNWIVLKKLVAPAKNLPAVGSVPKPKAATRVVVSRRLSKSLAAKRVRSQLSASDQSFPLC